MDPRIADYIRENRRRYTRDAITKQLANAGHHPEEIDRVWAALETPDADTVAGEGFWGRFALILVAVNVGVFILVVLVTGMLGAGGAVIAVIFGIVLVIGALIAWGVVAATGPARLRPGTALVVGTLIPLLFALLIGGACYAMVGGVGLGGGGGGGPAPAPMGATMDISLTGPLEVEDTADAFCQLEGGGAIFLNAQSMTADGRPVLVSINSFENGPAGSQQLSLLIEAPPTGASESFPTWATDQGPEVEAIDWTFEGNSGGVTFRGLPGLDQGQPGAPVLEPLDGEISWTCDGSAP